MFSICKEKFLKLLFKKYLFTFYIVIEQVIQWGKKFSLHESYGVENKAINNRITHINTRLQVVLSILKENYFSICYGRLYRRIQWRLEDQEKDS